MPYCANCGCKLSENCNFCPQCGQSIKQERQEPESIAPPEENIPPRTTALPLHKKDHTFTLLDSGEVFNKVYKIEKVIGKDNDGISYLAFDERNGNRCSLKLFFQSYFDNVDKLFGAIVRMSKIKAVKHPNIAKVYEVNQTHKPAFIVSEYIDGLTLQEVKDQFPELFTEEYVRVIAGQIVSASLAIRKAGLAVRTLGLQNIVRTEEGNIIILSTGINYDVRDESEDIFTIGIVLAKLFTKSTFYETIYVPLKLLSKKFDYISGITIGVNEILAECLHRKAEQRYASFDELAKALDKLKPIQQNDIYVSADEGVTPFIDQNEMTLPTKKLDIYFWGIIIFILVFICIALTTNLLDAVFGNKNAPLKFTGFMTGLTDSTAELSSIADDNYRDIKTESKTYSRKKSTLSSNPTVTTVYVNPNVTIPAAQSAINTSGDIQNTNVIKNQTPSQKRQVTPDNLVYIYGDTYAYGTLHKNVRENASLNGFYMSINEVTQAEWTKYMRRVTCSNIGDNLPVDNISWFDAIIYCNSRSEAEGLAPCYKIMGFGASRIVTCNFKVNGYRLPTEAEWEYAARGNKYSPYSGADSPDLVGWYKDNASAHIHPVKFKTANAFGLYDMTGNVAEWCWDWYDANYPKSMPFINPTGPELGNLKVIRGGSIESAKGSSLEVIYRNKGVPFKSYKFVGFRVVRGK